MNIQKFKKIILYSSTFLFSTFYFLPALGATFNSNILPTTDNANNIGFPTLRWQDLYLSQNLIVGGTTLVGNSASDPAGTNGIIYYNTNLSAFRNYRGEKWADLGQWNFSNTTNHIYNSNSGNVGIGISNPPQKLTVNGTLRTKGFLMPAGAKNNYILTSDANGTAAWKEPVGGLWTASGKNIYNLNSGNVGIGNNNPQEKLHISNGTLLIDNNSDPSMLGASIATAKINNLETSSISITNNLDADLTGDLRIGNLLSVGDGGIYSSGEISSSDFLQFGKSSTGPPDADDCRSDSERGRITLDTNSNLLYVCNGATRGWDTLSLFD